MAHIPIGEFDARRIADEFYDNDEIRRPLFQDVYDLWPGNEWERAIDMILDGFEEAVGERYSEEEWDRIREELFESVDAGLT